MTPQEVLEELGGMGYRLYLRPGGVRLAGEGIPPPKLLDLIREHRDGLMDLLEAEAQVWEAHQASKTAGRVTTLPAHVLGLVHPSLRGQEAEEPFKKSRSVMDRRPFPGYQEGAA